MTNRERARVVALKLKPADRAELADILLGSLDEEYLEEVEVSWLDEADRRWKAYKKGEIKSQPGEEFLRKLNAGECP